MDVRASRILAYVKDGHITFVTDNISQSQDDVKGLALHEIGVHSALTIERAERLSSQWGAANLVEHPLPSAHLNDYTVNFLAQVISSSKVVDENGEGLTRQATSRMMHTSQSIL